MPIRVQAPNGETVEFPDGTPDNVMADAMRRTYGGPHAVGQAEGGGALNTIGGGAASILSGLPFVQDIQAALATAVDQRTWQGRPGEAYKSNREAIRGNTEGFRAAHPVAGNMLQTGGMGASMLIPGLGAGNIVTKAPAAASVGARAANTGMNLVRGGVAAGSGGAAYALGADGTTEQRLENARNAAVISAALGGPLAARAGRSPRVQGGSRQQQTDLLVREGVPLTPGQARGGVAKALEDAGTSVPYLGTKITEARNAGLEHLSRVPINRGLRDLGLELPEGVVGTDAVDAGQRIYNTLYDNARPPGNIVLDQELAQTLSGWGEDIALMTQANQDRLAQTLRSVVGGRTDVSGAAMTPDAFQRASSQLRKQAERFTKSGDPDHQAMGEIMLDVRRALRSAAGRQHEGFAEHIAKVDRGYVGFKQAQDAAGRATDASGISTPAQLAAAIKRSDKTLDRGRWASGRTLNHDLAEAANAVLPSKIGNSGTADRSVAQAIFAAPAAGAGLAAGGAPGALVGAGIGAAAVPMIASRYTPRAIEAYNAALRAGLATREGQAAMEALRGIAGTDDAAARLYQDAMLKLSAGAGAETATAGAAR